MLSKDRGAVSSKSLPHWEQSAARCRSVLAPHPAYSTYSITQLFCKASCIIPVQDAVTLAGQCCGHVLLKGRKIIKEMFHKIRSVLLNGWLAFFESCHVKVILL